MHKLLRKTFLTSVLVILYVLLLLLKKVRKLVFKTTRVYVLLNVVKGLVKRSQYVKSVPMLLVSNVSSQSTLTQSTRSQ